MAGGGGDAAAGAGEEGREAGEEGGDAAAEATAGRRLPRAQGRHARLQKNPDEMNRWSDDQRRNFFSFPAV